jgi:hypothetical protein
MVYKETDEQPLAVRPHAASSAMPIIFRVTLTSRKCFNCPSTVCRSWNGLQNGAWVACANERNQRSPIFTHSFRLTFKGVDRCYDSSHDCPSTGCRWPVQRASCRASCLASGGSLHGHPNICIIFRVTRNYHINVNCSAVCG